MRIATKYNVGDIVHYDAPHRGRMQAAVLRISIVVTDMGYDERYDIMPHAYGKVVVQVPLRYLHDKKIG